MRNKLGLQRRIAGLWLPILFITVATSGCREEVAVQLPQSPLGPVARFSRNEIDLGRVRFEANLEETIIITLTNEGDKRLEILGFERSCGCTQLNASNVTLTPGETSEITAKISITDPGERIVRASVLTNVGGGRRHELRIRWDAFLPVAANPEMLEFGRVQSGNEYLKVVELTADPSYDSEPTMVEVQYESREIFLDCDKDGSNVVVKLVGPKEVGEHHAILVVSFDRMAKPLRIPVSCEVRNAVSIVPPAVHFGNVSPGMKIEKKLLLRTDSVLPIHETPSVSIVDNPCCVAWERLDDGMLLGTCAFEIPTESGPFTQEYTVSTSLGECRLKCSGFVELRHQ